MDNLQFSDIKTGDEICTILRDGSPGSLYTAGEFNALHNKFQLLRHGKIVGLIPSDGLGYYAMHKQTGTPHFYYSKNPAHIALVKKSMKDADKLKKLKEQENRKLLKSLLLEIKELVAERGASIYACQTSGDDQGVQVGMFLSINGQVIKLK